MQREQTPGGTVLARLGADRVGQARQYDLSWLMDQVLHPASSPAAFGMHVYGIEPAAHHWRWLEAAVDPGIKRLLIIAPRDSAKTTWIANVLMAWHIGRNPLSTNFIGSVTGSQAHDRAMAIKMLIESAGAWAEVFPHIVPDFRRGWSANGLSVMDNRMPYRTWVRLVGREGIPNTPTLTFGGVGSGVVIGKRLTGLIVIDDPHDDKNSATALQRDRVWTWLMQVVVPCMTASARIVVITTRWQRDDTAGRLMRPDLAGLWTVIDTPAITTLPSGEQVSYWPERWPLERLAEKRREIGSAFFRAMYMNDPVGLAGSIFDASWFQDIPRPLPAFERVLLGVDLAVSQHNTADYTVIATCGVDSQRNLYILGMRRARLSFNDTILAIQDEAAKAQRLYGRCDHVAVEDVGYQKAAVQELMRQTDLPIISQTPHGDKPTRANLWAARAEQGAVFVDKSALWWPALADECVDFPFGTHDDQVDAISLAWACLRRRVSVDFA